jgi:hypothetical protein
MIETASSWVLPDSAPYRREPARPVDRRPANFESLFDARTVFYDCFRLTPTKVMLIGPPLTRFDGILDSLSISSLPEGTQCRYEVDHKFATGFPNRRIHNLCRVVADVPENASALHLESAAGKTVVEIRPNAGEMFRERRVLVTLSRNNDLSWICDWMRFHRDLQSADAVLLYDNGSTAYTVRSLFEAMMQVSGFKAICVVEWPYKYGPQGVGRGTWDSAFCQDGALEDARWRFLTDAYGVLSCDVDELCLSHQGSVFGQASSSKSGYVKFSGRWVNALSTPENSSTPVPSRHRDSTHQLLPHWRWKTLRPKDMNLCPAKWAVVPRRCPQNAQWSVHEIVDMQGRRLPIDETCYRHFRQIGTNWKSNRTRVEPHRPRDYKPDGTLLEAFAKVNWDV